MNQKEKLLTIGQFAAMHGINKKTLMWYDEIGLFKPAFINPENGYRCYTYRQSPILETILLLRELDMSINEIQRFMENRSAASLKSLLEEKISDLEGSITHLQAVRKTLGKYQQNMSTLLTMDLSEISMIEKEEHCLITVDIDRNTSFEQEVEMVTAATEKYHLGKLHDANYGSMISVNCLYDGSFDDYSKIFIEIPFLTVQQKLPITGQRELAAAKQHERKNRGLHIQPGGKYLRAFHKGDWGNLPLRYQEILDYANSQELTLCGFSYEMGINEIVTERMEDYITQIEIPIQE